MTSFIICSIDAAKFSAVSRDIAERMADEPHEIIGVHDAKSMCEGYNRAVPRARGDVIVFCHDDVEILSPDFRQKLSGHMSRFDVAGVAGTRRVIGGIWSFAGPPYLFGQVAEPESKGNGFLVALFGTPQPAIDKIQALDGLFIAVRRDVLGKVRWDEATFGGWHGYDTDFTFSAHLAGFRVGVMADIALLHASAGHLTPEWQNSMELFRRKHARNIHPMPPRQYRMCQVHARTKAEALEIMNAAVWDER